MWYHTYHYKSYTNYRAAWGRSGHKNVLKQKNKQLFVIIGKYVNEKSITDKSCVRLVNMVQQLALILPVINSA